MTPTRRQLLLGAAALSLMPMLAYAEETEQGFRIDWQGGEQTPEVAASLAAQIKLVRSLQIKPDIAAFFASQVITIDLPGDTRGTRAGPRGVFFERRPVPPENPVLLHELIHRYHLLRISGGHGNTQVIGFYNQAKDGGLYPPTAYMLKNQVEFLAMMVSTVLWGKTARPPFARAAVAEKSPEMYKWIVEEFGLRT